MNKQNKILDEVIITKKLDPKKYKTVTPKTRLYPSGEVENSKIDSIKRVNPALAKAIGDPFRYAPGYQAQYGTDQSDLIKAALKRNR